MKVHTIGFVDRSTYKHKIFVTINTRSTPTNEHPATEHYLVDYDKPFKLEDGRTFILTKELKLKRVVTEENEAQK